MMDSREGDVRCLTAASSEACGEGRVAESAAAGHIHYCVVETQPKDADTRRMRVNPLTSVASKALCRTIGGVLDTVKRRFPAVVRLETTNACNACCLICPHRQMQRPITTMDKGLYARLIDECVAAGCRKIHLHNFGEPLLDQQLEDRIAYAKQKGIRLVRIFCNGSLLSPDRARRLIEAGLDEVKVSLDGATREEFERIRTPSGSTPWCKTSSSW